MATTTRLYTVEELERNPPANMPDWELIDGELSEVPAAGDRASSTAVTIAALLWIHARPRRLGRVYGADGGFVLFPGRQTMRAPDVSFVRADRVPSERDRDRFPRLAPDLAVEVRSPDDRRGEVLAKIEMYLEAGVRFVWLADPRARIVEVFAPGAEPVTLTDGDRIDGGDVLPGFAAPVASFFD